MPTRKPRPSQPTDQQIAQQLALLEQQRAAMTPSFQTARGKVGSLVYQYEIVPASDTTTKKSRLQDVNEAKSETYEFDYPSGGGKTELEKLNYDQLNQLFTDLMAQKAELVTQQGEADATAKDAQDKLNDYMKRQVAGHER